MRRNFNIKKVHSASLQIVWWRYDIDRRTFDDIGFNLLNTREPQSRLLCSDCAESW